MKLYTQRLGLLFALLAITIGLNSCVDEPYYPYAELAGSWYAYSSVEGNVEVPIYADTYDQYEFSDYDYRGYYTSNQVRTEFVYEYIGPHHIYIRHSDGFSEDFFWQFDGEYLLVSSDPSFYRYRVYSPYLGDHPTNYTPAKPAPASAQGPRHLRS